MAYTDVRGLTLTTSSSEAVDAFNQSIADNAEYRLSAGDRMGEAIAADPNFTMAHCVMGYYMMGAEALAPPGAGRACLEAAEATELDKVTPRERASVAALRCWVEGRQDDALLIWEKILDDNPLDLLTMQLLHYRSFWLGKEEGIRDSVSRYFDRWDFSVPNYSNVLGMYCFGLNENGNGDRALEYGRKAIDLNKNDLWSVHAVAHVLNDRGEQHAGIAFFDQFDKTWEGHNAIREHLWWHEALLWWELGDFEKTLNLYDEYFAKNITPFYLDIQNSASMLWRLESVGVDVGNRWHGISEVARKRMEYRYLPWTDIHVAMTLGRTGDTENMGKFMNIVRGDAGNAVNARQVGAAETNEAVCGAIQSYCEGNYSNAIEKLVSVRADNFRHLGASNAQRDVIGGMVGVAALKAKEFALARTVFAQRLEEKPKNQMTWLFYADAAEGCGDSEAAKRARAMATTVEGAFSI